MSDVISRVLSASDTATRDIGVEAVLTAIRTGGKKLRGQIEQIRNRFEAELAITGDLKAAKRAVDQLKKDLPGVTWSGRFSYRASDKLLQHSGLFIADLDALGEKLPEIRKKLEASQHVFALFLSPSGEGLKAVFRVPADASKHAGSFRAVVQHVRELTGVQIDESGKDVARLCFISFDPELYHNPNATALEPLPEPEKPKATFKSSGEVNLSERQRIATELLGGIDWQSETSGYCVCPGIEKHGSENARRDCRVSLDNSEAPTVFCVHTSCKAVIETYNYKLRSLIGKSEFVREPDVEQPPSNGEPVAGPRKSAATELVQLAEGFEFFHDRQDRPFVRLENDGHREVWPVESSKFRKLLARMFYKHTDRAINRNAVGDAITTLAGKASYDGGEEPVFLRVAPHGENILIDLCDAAWRVVEVTPTGWRILDKSPVAFIRTGSMQSLPLPVQGGGSIAPLWKLLNVTPKQRPLVAGALLNAFHPNGPYFVVNYVGEGGTAKSCGAKIHRQLIDPNENPLRSPPKEERDLLVQAACNRCVAIDNLSSLPPWLSDGLCRVATGGGHSARSLYTDLEETSLSVKRPIILNGIEDVAERPDLAERCLQIELETIDGIKRKRILEEDLWPEFEKHRVVIFSGILDALVCALRERPVIKLKLGWLPRMADPTVWATAGETAFDFERGTFIQAYRRNLDEGAIASLEAHSVGGAIGKLLEVQRQWSGTATALLEALNALLPEEERRVREKDKDWPQNPRSLGHALRRLAQALRRAGISYERDRSKRRLIHLCSGPDRTSRTSTTTPCPEGPTQKNDDVDDVEPPTNTQRSDDVDDVDVLSPHLHVDTETPPEPDAGPQTGEKNVENVAKLEL